MCLLVVSGASMLTLNDLKNDNAKQEVALTETVSVNNLTATMYEPVTAQCDDSPLITAANYKINPDAASEHKYVALSRDLLKRWGGKLTYGDKVYISNIGEKSGEYTVADTMNKRYKNRIDILETAGTDWYKYHNVSITKLNS